MQRLCNSIKPQSRNENNNASRNKEGLVTLGTSKGWDEDGTNELKFIDEAREG